jgi:hypothetical protein
MLAGGVYYACYSIFEAQLFERYFVIERFAKKITFHFISTLRAAKLPVVDSILAVGRS